MCFFLHYNVFLNSHSFVAKLNEFFSMGTFKTLLFGDILKVLLIDTLSIQIKNFLLGSRS